MVTKVGRWHFLAPGDSRHCDSADDKPAIGIDMGGSDLYDFELERCDTEAAVGNWLFHLSQKEWWERGDAEDFLELLLMLHDEMFFVLKVSSPQAGRCAAMDCLCGELVDHLCLEHSKVERGAK